MLNSNFDLRTFLTESKASTEQIQEATLTEATVMEYIRERMSSMNNEVRSCMKEYLERCNEIDMEHDDAHAQLMNALEDFYNKLKAHFEEDAAAEDLPMDTEVPAAPVGTIGDEPLEEGEEDFGGEEDENQAYDDGVTEEMSKEEAWEKFQQDNNVTDKTTKIAREDFEKEWAKRTDEVKVKVSIPGQDEFEAEEGKDYSEEEADEYIKNAKDSGATPMNTEFEKVSEEVVSEGLDPETVDLLMGLAKTAVSMGTVPAALAILYQFKDHPKIAKVVTAFEKHLDK